MEIIKQIKYKGKDVEEELAKRLANVELQLATEKAANKAIVKYAEELEKKLNDKKSSPANNDTKE